MKKSPSLPQFPQHPRRVTASPCRRVRFYSLLGASRRGLAMAFSLGAVLAAVTASHAATYVWDADSLTDNAQDGTGTWQVGLGNWFDQTNTLQNRTWVDGNDVVFGAASGAAGTVTLGGPITANSLTFNAAGSGTYTLSGSTLTLTTGSITANVAATISSILAGSAGLTKAGSGTLTLSGSSANTYTGLTTINAGGLTLSKTAGVTAVAGDILVNAAGTLTLGANEQIANTASITIGGGAVTFAGKSETLNNITLNSGTFITGNSGTTTSTVTLNGTLTIAGGSTSALTVNSGAVLSAQAVALTGSGGILIGTNLATQLVVGSGGLSMSGQTITMNAGSATSQIVLNGDVTASGSNSIVANGGTSNSVQIGSASRTFTIASGGTTTIGPGIVGTGGSLVKQGAGVLALTGASTYTGATTVNAGTLQLTGTGGKLNGTSGVVVTTGGTLTVGSGTAATNEGVTNRIATTAILTLGGGSLTMAYATTNTSQSLAGLVVAAGAGTIKTANAAAGTLGLNFNAATGSYVRTIGGTVNIVSSTGFTIGFTTVPTAAAGSSVAGTGTDAILIGATLDSNDFVTAQSGTAAVASYLDTGTSTWTAGKNMNVTGSVTAAAGSSANSVRFGTAGAFTISLDGTTTLDSGSILVTSAVGSNLSTISGGTLLGSAGGDLLIIQNNTSGGLTISSTIANNGSATGLTKTGSGLLTLSGTNTYTGQTFVTGGTLSISSNAALGDVATGAQLTLDGATLETTATITLANGTDNKRNIVLGAGGATFSTTTGTLTVSGNISGSGALTKTGTGTLQLSGANSYTGTTTISGGLVQLGADNAFGSGTLVLNGANLQTLTAARTLSNAVTLQAATAISGSQGLTLNGTFTMSGNSFTVTNSLSGGALTLNGNVYLTSGAVTVSRQITFVGSGATIINGVVADNNAGSTVMTGITLNSAGTVTLNGVNTYTGRTITAGGGSIIVSQDRNFGAVPTASQTDSIILAQTGTLRVTNSFTLDANRNIGIGATTGTNITGTISVDAGQTFTVAGSVTNRTVNADGSAVTGTNVGSLTKLGSGTLALAGVNTYSGNTTVTAGTLLVSGSISGLASANPAVSVASNATLALSGSGSISANTLSLGNNSKLSLEVGSLTSNTISLTGAATIAGTVTLALTLTADPTDGLTFTLIDGTDALAGYSTGARFAVNGSVVDNGGLFTISNGSFSQVFQLNYGTGADVTILAVPEPGAVALLWGATGLMLGTSRFRRRMARPTSLAV